MTSTVFKVKHFRNFTTVSNEWINNPALSAKAKGILLYLLSKPNDWVTNLQDIVSNMLEGVDAIRSGIKELQMARHIVKVSIRDPRGKITGWETQVFESPLPKAENPECGKPTLWETQNVENPECGKPTLWETQNVGNPTQLNTKDIYISTDLDLEELKTDQEPNTEKTKSQNCSAAVADTAILANGVGQAFGEVEGRVKTLEPVGKAIDAHEASRSSQSVSGGTAYPEKASKKKKRQSREFTYLKVFQNNEAMKQDFVALYRVHPKHTLPQQAADAYFRLRQAGATAEEILAAHREALDHTWRGRTVQLHPKLADWLSDLLANRDLGIESDRSRLLHAEQYQQVRAEYFQVCAQLDAPFGDEEQAQAMWNSMVSNPQNLDGIMEATPYYLDKKRKREGEPICRFERYLQHRWQVVLAHKHLKQDGTVSTVAAKSFIEWFNLATSVRVIQNFSSSDIGITGLPAGSIGVRPAKEERWQDWQAIAQHYPIERLQQLKAEQELRSLPQVRSESNVPETIRALI